MTSGNKVNRTIKKPLLLLSIFAALIFIAIVYGKKQYTFENSPPKFTPTPIVSNASDELSENEYNKLRDNLSLLVNQQDPKAALAQLQTLMNIDPKVLRSCHALVHEIGHASLKKYNNFGKAISYQDDVCGSGYLHGVIEQDFSTATNFFAAMQTICEGDGLSASMGKCYHGIGHGFMYYTGNDIPKSLYYCDTYGSIEKRSYCSEGVFMENFNSQERFHPSKYLNPNDPFYPCAQQTAFYKDAC